MSASKDTTRYTEGYEHGFHAGLKAGIDMMKESTAILMAKFAKAIEEKARER